MQPEKDKLTRENNFNLLRLGAASMVTIEHAYHLNGQIDPLENLTGIGTGGVAVSVFFIMSGFLIQKSAARSKSIASFIMARNLRLFPGLVIMLMITTFGLGVIESTRSGHEYITDKHTWLYLVGNGLLFFPQSNLPGVFENNPMSAVNGSLWTLRFEYICYIVTYIMFLLGIFKTRSKFLLFSVIFILFYITFYILNYHVYSGTLMPSSSFVPRMFRLFFSFFIGITTAVLFDAVTIRLWHICAALVAFILLINTFLNEATMTILLCVIVFYVAYSKVLLLSKLRIIPDISYGMYIYAFPVQQVLISHFSGLQPWINVPLTLALTAIPATLSWFIVEKPALAYKKLF